MNSSNKTQPIRHFLVALFACAALVAAVTAVAAPYHHGPGDGGDDSVMMLQRLARAVERLQLTEAQRDNIRATLEARHEELVAIREASRELRLQLHELVTADTLDEAALAELARQEGELAAERTMIAAGAGHAVLAELDAAQREELELMRQERMERRAGRYEWLRDRAGDGPGDCDGDCDGSGRRNGKG